MQILRAAYALFLAICCTTLARAAVCSPSMPSSWIVEDSAGASALASATNCVGGVFDVEWRGHVEFPETIHVLTGTFLNITGAGPGAVAVGTAINQFLNVADATVHVSGMRIENCSAELGGAIYVNASVVTFNETSFSYNTATGDGGAVYLTGESLASWTGETLFESNAAADDGGAVYLNGESLASWTGETLFGSNTAADDGGAIYFSNSDVSWSGEMTFAGNVAGGNAGAVFVDEESHLSWTGETKFQTNAGAFMGGGIYANFRSTVSWSGETNFSGNSVGTNGGAFYVRDAANVNWSGRTSFSGNSGGEGGAIMSYGELSWTGETSFSGNNAGRSGGALYVSHSYASWGGNTSFSKNTAVLDGGALNVWGGGDVHWYGETDFSSNTARENGGAVGVEDESSVSWTSRTTFFNNSCGGSGGALVAMGAINLAPGTSLFDANTAQISGGAVFMSSVGSGPVFVGSNFTANVSPRGGAVYSASSGTETVGYDTTLSVTYQECLFVDNRASSTGGAIESAAGYDEIAHTVFEGNTAGVGGALRLGGSAYLTNCTFVDNISDEDEGAAISNVGVMETSFARFSGNVFQCEPGTYVDLIDGDRYGSVCSGCPVCDGCDVQDESLVPVCTSQMEHTRSEGGDTTIETLDVDYGYWRATPTSRDVLTCYNEDACLGGVTGGPDFCRKGYEGPCECQKPLEL